MKIFQIVVLISVFLFFSQHTNAQQLKENEVVVISGEKYILHQVRTGETIFSISQRFEVDSETLVQDNPNIREGLKIGEILKIPYNENITFEAEPVFKKGDPTGYKIHKIESRSETPYFIAKNYDITVEELYAYNPEVRKFRRGTEVRIPVWEKIENEKLVSETASDEQGENELIEHTVISGETLYSISRRYNLTEDEISQYNPGAIDLKAGSILFLPKKTNVVNTTLSSNDEVANYFEHIIESGETLWGMTQKYNVSESELRALNPFLADGFPAGAVLKVPVNDVEPIKVEPVNENAFIQHEVERGETLYGLSMKYNIKIPDIKKYNPVLETRNLLRGETILIPKIPEPEIAETIEEKSILTKLNPVGENEKSAEPLLPDYYDIEVRSETPVTVPESCKPQLSAWNSFETYQVALFLPLFMEANDTLNKIIILPETDSLEADLEQEPLVEIDNALDTTVEEVEKEDMFIGFYRGSEKFVQFYEGVFAGY